jgi:hypothetical protein
MLPACGDAALVPALPAGFAPAAPPLMAAEPPELGLALAPAAAGVTPGFAALPAEVCGATGAAPAFAAGLPGAAVQPAIARNQAARQGLVRILFMSPL